MIFYGLIVVCQNCEFEFLMDLVVGDVVVLDGAVIGWFNGPISR